MIVKYKKCVESNKTSRGKDEEKGAFVGTRVTHGISCVYLFVVFIMTSFVVCGDDTNAIRDTLSSLCSLNSVGQFGSCCKEHPTGSISFSRRDSWSCYANDMKTNDEGDLSYLFVFLIYPIRIPHILHRDLSSKNLTDFGEYGFSSLTNLVSLLFLFFLFIQVFDFCGSLKGNDPKTLSINTFYGLTNLVSLHSFPSFLSDCFNSSDR